MVPLDGIICFAQANISYPRKANQEASLAELRPGQLFSNRVTQANISYYPRKANQEASLAELRPGQLFSNRVDFRSRQPLSMLSQNYQAQMDEKQVTDTSDPTIEKRIEGANGSVLIDVPHITDWLPQATVFPNNYAYCKQTFVEEDDVVYKEAAVKLTAPHGGIYFRRAGPRAEIYFRPDEVRACIVTCGSLSSGLNTVIREIVCGLWTQYGVHEILGIDGGFRGFYSRNTIPLSPRVVDDIHKRGGTYLGTSFDGFDKSKIVNSIIDRRFNQVYIIGGDGAQRGAKVIYEELRKRGLKTTVAGIPKTSDNDIAVIDKAVGFETAVEEAQRAINAAHTEAQSARNGIGLVKLMGRHSGEIAVHATLASRDVDICLIPEAPFYLDGKGGFYEFVQRRLRENGHMVIVVAEGAGQDLMEGSLDTDRKGSDIGLWLSQKIKDHFAQRNVVVNLKYIDPTYMIRAIPSNASENIYCTLLAHSAVHGSMAGYSGYTVGPINGRHAYIPFHIIIDLKRRVNTADEMWAKLLSSTNQPNFLKA